MPASEREPGYYLLAVATLDGEALTGALHYGSVRTGQVYPDTITHDGLIDELNRNHWKPGFAADLEKRWKIARDVHHVTDIVLAADLNSTDDSSGNNRDNRALLRAASTLQDVVGSSAKVHPIMLATERRGHESDFVLACMNGRGLHSALPEVGELNQTVHHRLMTWPGMVAFTKEPGSNPKLDEEIARRIEIAKDRGVRKSAVVGHDNCVEHTDPQTGQIVPIKVEEKAIYKTAGMLSQSFDQSHAILVERRRPTGRGLGSEAKLIRRAPRVL